MLIGRYHSYKRQTQGLNSGLLNVAQGSQGNRQRSETSGVHSLNLRHRWQGLPLAYPTTHASLGVGGQGSLPGGGGLPDFRG